MPIMVRWTFILIVSACSLLLVDTTDGSVDPDTATFDSELLSPRLVSSAIRIALLEEKLNDAQLRVKQLKTMDGNSEFQLLEENVDLKTFSCPERKRDFRCGNDSIQCVSDLLICDGVSDCRNGADERPSLCDDLPFNVGEIYSGWVHYKGCFALPDHLLTFTVASVGQPGAFRARRYLHTIFINYFPPGPVVYHVPGLYNPSRRTIIFDMILGLSGDCRFKGRDQLDCIFVTMGSRIPCSNFTMSRRPNSRPGDAIDLHL